MFSEHKLPCAHPAHPPTMGVDLVASRGNLLATHQVSDALQHMPSLLVLDDLDLLCPAASADPGAPPAPPHADALVQWLADVLDALRPADGLAYPGVARILETSSGPAPASRPLPENAASSILPCFQNPNS